MLAAYGASRFDRLWPALSNPPQRTLGSLKRPELLGAVSRVAGAVVLDEKDSMCHFRYRQATLDGRSGTTLPGSDVAQADHSAINLMRLSNNVER